MLTNLTYGIVPPFLWTLMMPVILLVSAEHALVHLGCSIRDEKDVFGGWEAIWETEPVPLEVLKSERDLCFLPHAPRLSACLPCGVFP